MDRPFTSKVCIGCKESKPYEPEFFEPVGKDEDRLRTKCRECRRADRQRVRDKLSERELKREIDYDNERRRESLGKLTPAFVEETERTLQKMDQHSIRLLGVLSPKTRGENASIPHISETFQHIMVLFGGSEGYARHLMETYLLAKPGSPLRASLLKAILKTSQYVSESGAAKIPLDLLSDEDLENELAKRIRTITMEPTGE